MDKTLEDVKLRKVSNILGFAFTVIILISILLAILNFLLDLLM